MKLSQRLHHLEERLGLNGRCLACRDRRDWVTLVDVEHQADGTVTYLQPLPSPCAACGEIPGLIVQLTEEIVTAEPGRCVMKKVTP